MYSIYILYSLTLLPEGLLCESAPVGGVTLLQLKLRASAWNRRENCDSGPAITLGFQGNATATPPPITCENPYDALKLSCMGAALRGGPASHDGGLHPSAPRLNPFLSNHIR